MIIKSNNENLVSVINNLVEVTKLIGELTIICVEFENKIIKNYVLKTLEQVEQSNDIKKCIEITNKAKHRIIKLLRNKHIINKLSVSDIINQLDDIEKELTIDIFLTYQNFVELYKEACSLSDDLYFVTPGEFLDDRLTSIKYITNDIETTDLFF